MIQHKNNIHAVIFTVVNPMDDEQILVQFIARSRRRTAILPNKVQCGRPL